jgi:hypothetical protein
MKYDNVRDSKSHGQEWGMIVEGSVVQDPETQEWVLVDDEGVAFSPQEYLKQFAGKEVRFTCVPMEDARRMEDMLNSMQQGGNG